MIETPRLRLVTMGPDFLRASLGSDRPRAEALIGASLPRDWPRLAHVLRLRLGQLAEHPDHEPWLTRAIVCRASRAMAGVSGFHGPPGGAWLADFAPGGVEFGYTVFEPFRRLGFASEASRALMEWARDEHGVRGFVLSMAPDNAASAGLARKLGFNRVGEWQHEERGLEHVYRRVDPVEESRPG